ncbi:MAG TPA: hypothetical protein VJT77_05795 [Burkholderiales bacterium]|nr:hypothetical protein [Burkholderiales bacterium]
MKTALIAGVGSWALSTAWLLSLFDSSPSPWPVAALAGIAAVSALGSSLVLVEVRRSFQARPVETHIGSVLVWAVVLFVVQLTGIHQALGPLPEFL